MSSTPLHASAREDAMPKISQRNALRRAAKFVTPVGFDDLGKWWFYAFCEDRVWQLAQYGSWRDAYPCRAMHAATVAYRMITGEPEAEHIFETNGTARERLKQLLDRRQHSGAVA